MDATSLRQYTLSEAGITQPASLVYTESNQLLISRIPSDLPLASILWDLESVGVLMGVTIDVDEFKSRFIAGKGVFQANDNRISIVVYLSEVHNFHTLGALRSKLLPLVLTTEKGSLRRTTSVRYMVQALPEGSPVSLSSMHEVLAVRGFPDSCHMVSSLFPLVLLEIFNSVSSTSLLCVFSSVRNVRPRGYRGGNIEVDEVFLQCYVEDENLVSVIRNRMSCSNIPSSFSSKCGKGQKRNHCSRMSPPLPMFRTSVRTLMC